jgi:hypothetical protein
LILSISQQLHQLAGYFMTAVFWLISTGCIIGIAFKDHSGALYGDLGASMADIYVKPWCRIGPYLIGLVAGYLLHKVNSMIRGTIDDN